MNTLQFGLWTLAIVLVMFYMVKLLKSCSHTFGPAVDRTQTCTKCGMVRVIECPHVWEKGGDHAISHTDIATGKEIITLKIYIRKCSKCGELSKFNVGVNG